MQHLFILYFTCKVPLQLRVKRHYNQYFCGILTVNLDPVLSRNAKIMSR